MNSWVTPGKTTYIAFTNKEVSLKSFEYLYTSKFQAGRKLKRSGQQGDRKIGGIEIEGMGMKVTPNYD